MEIDWSTFVLELLNFVVLVYLLKRFLYRPVLAVIEQRKAGIAKTLADAQAQNADAEALRAKYEGRVGEWEAERRRASDALGRELEAEKVRRLGEIDASVAKERERAEAAAAREQATAARKLESEALEQGARFAGRLVAQLASPELETRLVALALGELERLPPERAAALTSGGADAAGTPVVASAFPLSPDDRRRVAAAVARLAPSAPEARFVEKPALVAGLDIAIGGWSLGLNVRDELAGFARLGRGA